MSSQDTIGRCKSRDKFTVINNALIEDERLDWKALGLLVYLLSKPDHWKISPAHLAKVRKTGRDGIYSALKNICEAGYGEKHPNRIGGWDWKIREYSEAMPDTEKPDTEKPDTEKPDTEKPYTEKPYTENPTLVNTDIQVKTELKAKTDIQVKTELKAKTDLLVKQSVDKPKKPDELFLLSEFGIVGDLADDFIAHRKSKKAIVSKTVLNSILSEAVKANVSLKTALETMLLRNWQGFKAEWMLDRQGNQQSNQPDRKDFTTPAQYIPNPLGQTNEKVIN